MKLPLKIILIIVLILILILGIYFFIQRFKETKPSLPVTPPPPKPPVTLPPEIQKLKKISQFPAFDFFIDRNLKKIFYLDLNGKIYEVANNGKDILVSDQTLNALNKTEISPEKNKILVAFGNPLKPQWRIFDFLDRFWRPLPENLFQVTWGENDNELIGLLITETGVPLVKIDLSQNPPEIKTILSDFRMKDIELIYSGNQQLIIVERPSKKYLSRSWKLNLKDKTIEEFLPAQLDLIIKKQKVDQKIFFLYVSLNEPLKILDSQLKEITSLNTLPSKCVFSENQIFCFIPQIEPLGQPIQNLIDEYLYRKAFTQDILRKIEFDPETLVIKNTETLQEELTNEPFDIVNPQYFDNALYFINRYDNFLYELKL